MFTQLSKGGGALFQPSNSPSFCPPFIETLNLPVFVCDVTVMTRQCPPPPQPAAATSILQAHKRPATGGLAAYVPARLPPVGRSDGQANGPSGRSCLPSRANTHRHEEVMDRRHVDRLAALKTQKRHPEGAQRTFCTMAGCVQVKVGCSTRPCYCFQIAQQLRSLTSSGPKHQRSECWEKKHPKATEGPE